ncbi:MAG TPA: hypothetical protein DCS93_10985 [Microscillaceae bacterium]|nr:hypothetical protein [Microscillaceae bacterium]
MKATKLEYKVITSSGTAQSPANIDQAIANAGQEGWEVTSITRDKHPSDQTKDEEVVCVLRREVKGKAAPTK